MKKSQYVYFDIYEKAINNKILYKTRSDTPISNTKTNKDDIQL